MPTAAQIADRVNRGTLDPSTQFSEAYGPTRQHMSDQVLIESDKKCCAPCSKSYVLTDSALEVMDPRCLCCCIRTSHYNLTQVLDMQDTQCCGWCCSSLTVFLDSSSSEESVKLSCIDTRAFMAAMKPKIGRVRVGRRR